MMGRAQPFFRKWIRVRKPSNEDFCNFQGLGEIGEILEREAADHYGLKTVTEVTGEGTLKP